MNLEAKIFKKILANQIQAIKKNNKPWPHVIYSRSIKLVQYLKIKEGYVIISIHAEKVFY